MNKKIKYIIITVIALIIIAILSGCNRTIVDLKYNFTDAQIKMPDGTYIEGKVTNWRDYQNSDSIQLTIEGVVYYTHLSNVVLIG